MIKNDVIFPIIQECNSVINHDTEMIHGKIHDKKYGIFQMYLKITK